MNACALVPLAMWVLSKTRFGYHTFATGGNREGSRLHGVKVNRVTVIGFVLVASVWSLFFWEVFRSWKYVQRSQNDLAAKRSNKSSFVLGGTLGLVAILVHSFFDFNFHVPANALLAVTLLGLVTGHFRFATEGYWFTVRWPLKVVVTVVLLSAIVGLGVQTGSRGVSAHGATRVAGRRRGERSRSQLFGP